MGEKYKAHVYVMNATIIKKLLNSFRREEQTMARQNMTCIGLGIIILCITTGIASATPQFNSGFQNSVFIVTVTESEGQNWSCLYDYDFNYLDDGEQKSRHNHGVLNVPAHVKNFRVLVINGIEPSLIGSPSFKYHCLHKIGLYDRNSSRLQTHNQ
jgi:hypothetical protein